MPPDDQAPRRFAYIPGLDGIRGIWVVIGPLLYHARPDLVPGGILGIDLFFVLSSYLIVSILLNEMDRTGRLDLGGYAMRRVRRLLPALLSTLGFLTAWMVLFVDPQQVPRWTGAIVSTLTYSANWHEIVAGVSYFDEFATPSPLKHVWSFAIEEQFYLFAPFFLLAVARFAPRKREPALLAASVVLAVASAWWMSVVHVTGEDPSRAYYGTDTRAHSLLVGIAAAVLVRWWGPVRTRLGHRLAVAGAYVATAVLGLMIFTVSEQTGWMFERGGFLAVAIVSAFMVLGVAQPSRGPLHRLLEARPVRYVGKISYGLYLFHWPVYVLLTPDGIEGNALLALHLAVTFVLAALSFRLVERPVMEGQWPLASRQVRPAGIALAGSLAATAIMAGLLAANSSRPADVRQVLVPAAAASAVQAPGAGGSGEALGTGVAPDGPGGALDGGAATEVAGVAAVDTWVPPADRPLRLLVVGDSVMTQLATALQERAAEVPDELVVFDDSHLGCGVTRWGMRRIVPDEGGPVGDVCSNWQTQATPEETATPEVVSWPTAVEAFRPDASVLHISPWDVADRKVPGLADGWTHLGLPDFDEYAAGEYAAAVDTLSAEGGHVFLMLGAHLDQPIVDQNSPERIDHLNDLLRDRFEGDPRVSFVDYPSFVGPAGSERDEKMRPDGVHLSWDDLPEAIDWLLGEIRSGAEAA